MLRNRRWRVGSLRTLLVAVICLVLSGAAAEATVTTYSSSPSAFIPDSGTITDSIVVADTGFVNDVNVAIEIQHPILADVRVRLTAPDGATIVVLFDRDCGVGDGVDITLDDEMGGLPPDFCVNGTCLSGTYNPAEPLSAFDGLQINGTWTLEVSDNAASDSVDCDCDGLNVGPACPRLLVEWSMTIDFSPVVDADLTIFKDDGETKANPGDTLDYTIIAANDGPNDVTGATVADAFPADLTCTWTCTPAGGASCAAGGAGDINDTVDLPVGDSVTYAAACDVDSGASGSIDNTATITAPAGINDTDPANNSSTDSTALNQAPVAQCQDIEATADGSCQAAASIDDGSFDPEGEAITLSQDPPGPYGLGDTLVELTVTDELGLTDTCQGTVTVVDASAPVISCNSPATIVPPDAPIAFTATATDNCGVAGVVITSYDCFWYNPADKRVDKTHSCVVQIAGDTIHILDSGGVDDSITWMVTATDTSGNPITQQCLVTVVNPGQ